MLETKYVGHNVQIMMTDLRLGDQHYETNHQNNDSIINILKLWPSFSNSRLYQDHCSIDNRTNIETQPMEKIWECRWYREYDSIIWFYQLLG